MVQVKFYSMDYPTPPRVRYFIMIPDTHEFKCSVCGIAFENKQRIYLCGNMDGKAWHEKCYNDSHFKKMENIGEEKFHYDFRPWLVIAPKDLFEKKESQMFEFEVLTPKQ